MNNRKILSSLLLGAACALAGASCLDDQSSSGSSNAASAVGPRYIVSYKNVAGKAAVAHKGGVVVRDLPNHGFLSAHLPAAALKGLQNNPHIEFIEEDAKRYPSAVSESEGFPNDIDVEVQPYGIAMVQADQLTDAAAGNRTLCIIDSGIDAEHVDHVGNALAGTNDSGTGNWYEDLNHHGTHVAGTIAGLANGKGVVGVNPGGNLNLHIVKVFDANGWAYSSSLVAALDACEAAGANVVSMSLGGSIKSRSEDRAFKAADGRGVLSIAAAGNDGNTRHSYPASYDSVVSVAAIDEGGNLASFSQRTSQVELAAPGVAVLSSVTTGAGKLSTLDAGGDIASSAMDGSPDGSASGTLVDCGNGSADCPTVASPDTICLIARGDISFSNKVLACQNGGGAAAIIYNNEPGMLFGTLGEIVTEIPSIGVSDVDGAALAALLGTNASISIGNTSWAFYDGTSMATPHVSAVAALVWSYNPSWTNDAIRDALAATAIDLGDAGRDTSYGYGLIQAKAAHDYLVGASSCTPTETPETSCGDLIDNDCDGSIDGNDSDCAPMSTCEPPKVDLGEICDVDTDCCSNRCKGKYGSKTCK